MMLSLLLYIYNVCLESFNLIITFDRALQVAQRYMIVYVTIKGLKELFNCSRLKPACTLSPYSTESELAIAFDQILITI